MTGGRRKATPAPDDRRGLDLGLARVPKGSILGVNYSGMHDTSVALVAPTGELLFAVSLERVSRAKQDGRPPQPLLEILPWDRIACVAMSVNATLPQELPPPSESHPLSFDRPRQPVLQHGDAFYRVLASLPMPAIHVPHHLAHAAAAFFGSGLDEASCLVYDGGMCNENIFGGWYTADRPSGVRIADAFACARHANVTQLYTAVTAWLGFTPQKHEGKITGLAAYGRPSPRARELMREDLVCGALDGLFYWQDVYSEREVPHLRTQPERMTALQERYAAFSREDIAATVQDLAETHVVELVQQARARGVCGRHLTLSGGLFANVKVNQRVAALGWQAAVVAPAMTDDGTAAGAAWHVLREQRGPLRPRRASMFVGPGTPHDAATRGLQRRGIRVTRLEAPEMQLAQKLADGETVAMFRGRSEFGPRALGHRSILAPAIDVGINERLNQRLQRTEFMPFAPMIRAEEAAAAFELDDGLATALRFMTVTVNCRDVLREACPAVVHVDGTARPQIVHAEDEPFVHALLSHYVALTGRPAIVNTSFNVHEEPIVATLDDALRGFFETGLDHLYVDGLGLVSRGTNARAEADFLREKLSRLAGRQATARPPDRSRQTRPVSPALDWEGFGPPQAWGRFSTGTQARLRILDDGQAPSTTRQCSLRLFVPEAMLSRAPLIAVSINGTPAGYALFRADGPHVHTIALGLPPGPIALDFELRASLGDLGGASDPSDGGSRPPLCFGLAVGDMRPTDNVAEADAPAGVRLWSV